jgi:hypothetical protein
LTLTWSAPAGPAPARRPDVCAGFSPAEVLSVMSPGCKPGCRRAAGIMPRLWTTARLRTGRKYLLTAAAPASPGRSRRSSAARLAAGGPVFVHQSRVRPRDTRGSTKIHETPLRALVGPVRRERPSGCDVMAADAVLLRSSVMI